MYFNIKNYLKSTHNHISKHTLNIMRLLELEQFTYRLRKAGF
jgi:hypothetical protein